MLQTKIFIRITQVLIGLLLIIFSFQTTYGQSNKKRKLQQEYKSIINEIKSIQSNIDKTKKKRKAGLKQMALLNKKIDKRKKLISNIESQTVIIDDELALRMEEVKNLKGEIDILKKEYVKLIQWLGKNYNSTNKLAFVMEANGFKDAYRRIQYMKKYGNFRAKQSGYLKNQLGKIMEKVDALNETKKEKISIIEASRIQQQALTKEKENRTALVKKMDVELTTLRRQIADKNRKARAINKKIKKIINDEIRKEALRKAKESAKNGHNVDSKSDLSKTPSGILSSSFRNSKGRLPWPVSNGTISSKFGRTPHPAAPDLYIDNSGIDIRTNVNASVKSIYKGTVVRIFEMPTYKNCVLVKHGDYFSVYSYLKSVEVTEGAKVTAGQTLGICAYDESHGYSLVNLQIWHYQNKQNPQSWISQK